MSQSLSKIYLHIVFSTKNRTPFLRDQSIRSKMHAYLAGAFKGMESPAVLIGGTEDHVHVLCRFSRDRTVSQLIRESKRTSSKWIKTQHVDCRRFQWQVGYGAFSVSASLVEKVRKYIESQEQHHKKFSFQEEFRRLLKKHGIEFDERYVWD